MWQVEFHDAFLPEFEELAEPVQDELLAQLLRLREFGPRLGRPAVDTIKGSRVANLKELRFERAGACGGCCSPSIAAAWPCCWLPETRPA